MDHFGIGAAMTPNEAKLLINLLDVVFRSPVGDSDDAYIYDIHYAKEKIPQCLVEKVRKISLSSELGSDAADDGDDNDRKRLDGRHDERGTLQMNNHGHMNDQDRAERGCMNPEGMRPYNPTLEQSKRDIERAMNSWNGAGAMGPGSRASTDYMLRIPYQAIGSMGASLPPPTWRQRIKAFIARLISPSR